MFVSGAAKLLAQLTRSAAVVNRRMLAFGLYTPFYADGSHPAGARHLFFGDHGK